MILPTMMIAPMRLRPRLRPLVCQLILMDHLVMALLFLQTKKLANLFPRTINKILTSPTMMLLLLPLLINASLRSRHHRQRQRQRQYPPKQSTSKFLFINCFIFFDFRQYIFLIYYCCCCYSVFISAIV